MFSHSVSSDASDSIYYLRPVERTLEISNSPTEKSKMELKDLSELRAAGAQKLTMVREMSALAQQ